MTKPQFQLAVKTLVKIHLLIRDNVTRIVKQKVCIGTVVSIFLLL